MSLQRLTGEQVFVQKCIIKAHNLWSLHSRQRLWALEEIHNSHVTWFPAKINNPPFSDQALKLRSWPFAVFKDCRQDLHHQLKAFKFQLCIPELCLWALHSFEQLGSAAVHCRGATACPEIPCGLTSLAGERWLSVTNFHGIIASEEISLKGNLSGQSAEPSPPRQDQHYWS